jgi:hypothetical protein
LKMKAALKFTEVHKSGDYNTKIKS